MSDNLMDTEPGGEQTQYESIQTVTNPHKKSGGQFGEPETSVDVNPEAEASNKAEEGAKKAEKIRYGQAMSENGMGGTTTDNSGEADSAGADAEKGQRSQQGYSAGDEMSDEVGA